MCCTLVRHAIPRPPTRRERNEARVRKPLAYNLRTMSVEPFDVHCVRKYQEQFRDEKIKLRLQELAARSAQQSRIRCNRLLYAMMLSAFVFTATAAVNRFIQAGCAFEIEAVALLSYLSFVMFGQKRAQDIRTEESMRIINKSQWTSLPLENYNHWPFSGVPSIPEEITAHLCELKARLPDVCIEVEFFENDPFIRVFRTATDGSSAESYYAWAFDESGFVAP